MNTIGMEARIKPLMDVISDIRTFMYGGMITLPLTIAGTMLLLGLFTANYAMLFFLIGYLIVTPLLSSGLYKISAYISSESTFFCTKLNDTCKLNIKNTDKGSSPWVAMVSFFIGYIFTNGVMLYKYTPEGDAAESPEVKNRKNITLITMMSVVLFAAVSLGYRYYTKCEENVYGMGVSSVIFILLGVGWYKLLSIRGDDRLADLFGIANRLLGINATKNEPMACVPVGVPKCS